MKISVEEARRLYDQMVADEIELIRKGNPNQEITSYGMHCILAKVDKEFAELLELEEEV